MDMDMTMPERFTEYLQRRNAEIVDPKPTAPVVATGYLGLWMGSDHYAGTWIGGFSTTFGRRPHESGELPAALLSTIFPR